MASDTDNRTSSSSWDNLPVEARRTILNALLQTDGSLGAYAAVSREWQAIIEPHNFSHLKLTMPRIEQLERMAFRTQKHVQYIWLCLELEDYGLLEACQQEMSNADSHAIGRALYAVVDILSSWSDRPSLVLDISIHSPSDSAYWFKYLTFEPNHPFNERESRHNELPGLSVPGTNNDNSDNSDSDYIDDSDNIYDSDDSYEGDDNDDSDDNDKNDDNDDSHDNDDNQRQETIPAIRLTDDAINNLFNRIVVKGPFEAT